MVNHCAVGGCNNRHGRDTSSRRSFLVFHAVPRDAKRRKAWDKRVNRADHDIRRLKPTESAATTSATVTIKRRTGSTTKKQVQGISQVLA